MTAKLIDITGKPQREPVEGIVKLLEAWLERARKGEVRALSLIAIMEGNEFLTERCDGDLWGLLLAGHDVAKHDMLCELNPKD